MAAMDHAARKFDDKLKKCIKHAISPHPPAPPRRFASGTMRRVPPWETRWDGPNSRPRAPASLKLHSQVQPSEA
jgi:hypothetical protein